MYKIINYLIINYEIEKSSNINNIFKLILLFNLLNQKTNSKSYSIILFEKLFNMNIYLYN